MIFHLRPSGAEASAEVTRSGTGTFCSMYKDLKFEIRGVEVKMTLSWRTYAEGDGLHQGLQQPGGENRKQSRS
jgi:hypothetical protein